MHFAIMCFDAEIESRSEMVLFDTSFIYWCDQWSTVWFDNEAMDLTSQVNLRLLSESIKISHRSNDRQLKQ